MRRSLEEERRRADTLEQELGATRARLQEVAIERQIAYYRAEFFLRSYSYMSREPSVHRVQPCIPIYPWTHDCGLPVEGLDAATTLYLGDRDTCGVCLERFDSTGWYTLACRHRFHLPCLIRAMCTRAECPFCRHAIADTLYRRWGIDDLQPLPGKTVDLISRLPLGDEDRDAQALRDALTEEGYTVEQIEQSIRQLPPPPAQQYAPISDETRALWDTLIDESLRSHQPAPIPPEVDFVDPTLEAALRAAEGDTRDRFRGRVYADTRIWEMGHQARRTAADQELSYSRVRYLERLPARRQVARAPEAESSHAAEARFVAAEATVAEQLFGDPAEDPIVPSQRTIAERVLQEPRPRTQRGSYYELDSD